MHKIKKGIKKKIKGKKGKDKEDDLFSEEQLAKFKKELEAKAAQEGCSSEGQGSHQEKDSDEEGEASVGAGGSHPPQSSGKNAEEDEEWKKFKLLTSGVDSILKKTSGDLDRIKKESFFQRNPPNSAFVIPTHGVRPNATTIAKLTAADLVKKPDHVENTGRSKVQESDKEEETQAGAGWVDLESESKDSAFENEVPEKAQTQELAFPDSPEAIEVEDDLFDTSFLNAIESGDIKLAYIPDSPTEEETGDDPFDTSVADSVVRKIEEEEKRKKRQVNLGSVANVLAGRPGDAVDASAGAPTRKAPAEALKGRGRPRPHRINLLGLEGETPDVPPEIVAEEKTNTLLDEILGSPIQGPDPPLSELLATTASVTPVPVVKATTPGNSEADNLKALLSEFDVIDTSTPGPNISLASALLNDEEDLDDEFAALAVESAHKDHYRSANASPAPARPPPPGVKVQEPVTPEEPDPFDTAYVEAVCVEKVVEAPVGVDDDDDFDFDPRAGEEPCEKSTLSLQPDFLGESSSDLNADVGAAPLQPESDNLVEPEIHDPFDTSVVNKLLPGKAELKLLEEEFLSEEEKAKIAIIAKSTAIPDDDFDPRKEEKTVKALPPQRPPPPAKAPEIHPLDLVEDSLGDVLAAKALTPQVDFGENFEDEIDPFDTSIVSGVILPGKHELKLLESELVSPGQAQVASFPITTPAPSAVTVQGEVFGNTVNVSANDDFEDFDPRADEPVREPLPVPVITNPQDIFDTTPCELPTQSSPLLPLSKQEEVPIADPFDTSALEFDNFLPGKAELKFLEKELLDSTVDYQPPNLAKVPVPVPVSIPVPEPVPVKVPESEPVELHPLELDDTFHSDFADEPLQPLAVNDNVPNFDDPFDTTIANIIVPGKAELKILEAELFSAPNTLLPDPDFNPRHPSATLTSQTLIPQTVKPIAPTTSAVVVSEDIDPFDTTAADSILPGKTELKILEAELL